MYIFYFVSCITVIYFSSVNMVPHRIWTCLDSIASPSCSCKVCILFKFTKHVHCGCHWVDWQWFIVDQGTFSLTLKLLDSFTTALAASGCPATGTPSYEHHPWGPWAVMGTSLSFEAFISSPCAQFYFN